MGRLSPPEWLRYPDPATELDVLRLTDPAFSSGMTASHLRQFTRRGDSLLYWSERYEADPAAGSRQAFLLDLKGGGSRQLTEAAALDPASLALSADDRNYFFFDGPSLKQAPFTGTPLREIHAVPHDAVRSGFTIGSDGAAIFCERRNGRSRIVSVLRQQTRRIIEIDAEIDEVMTRPRHAQIFYRTGGRFWLVNTDGSGNRELKIASGHTGEVLWIPSGRTLIYLHIPDDAKELITLREHAPDDGMDTLLAKTSQFHLCFTQWRCLGLYGREPQQGVRVRADPVKDCAARIDALRTQGVRPGYGASGFLTGQPERSVCQRPAWQAGAVSGASGALRRGDCDRAVISSR